MDIDVRKFSIKEADDLIYDRGEPVLESVGRCYSDSFKGFHYFCPALFLQQEVDKRNFVLFANKDSDPSPQGIVGVLSVQYLPDFVSLGFVDVHEGFRSRRVATRLFRELNKHMSSSDKLVLSMLSDEGRKYQLDKVANRCISSCKVYLNEGHFYKANS